MDQIFIRDREIATKEYVDNAISNIPTNVVVSEGVTKIKQITQAEYDALETKASDTLYLIIG